MNSICAKSGCLLAETDRIPVEDLPPDTLQNLPVQLDTGFDIWEEFLTFLPDNLMDWLALLVIVCAVLSALLPAPPKKAPELCHVLYRAICALGLVASRLKGRGRGAAAKIGSFFRRRK